MKETRAQFKKRMHGYFYDFLGDTQYQTTDIGGKYAKKMLSVSTKVHFIFSGEDMELKFINSLVMKYAQLDSLGDNAYANETVALDMIIRNLDKDVEYCEKKSAFDERDLAEAEIRMKMLPPEEQRRYDVELVWQRERDENMRLAIASYKLYFDDLVFGALDSDFYDESEIVEFDSSTDTLQMPVFTHDPLMEDITKIQLGKNSFYWALASMASLYSMELRTLIKDCNNGNVLVRLWNPSKKEYEVVKVDKAEAYYQNTMEFEAECIWPALIVSALEKIGIDINTANVEDSIQCIFGPDKKILSAQELIEYTEPEETEVLESFAKSIRGYRKCFQDFYLAWIATDSIFDEHTPEFDLMMGTFKEAISATFVSQICDLDVFTDVINLLKTAADSYRALDNASNQKEKRRLQVCNAIDKLQIIFNDESYRIDPVLKYQCDFTEAFSKVYIAVSGQAVTDQAVQELSATFITNKKYKGVIGKIDIPTLCAAEKRTIEAVAAALSKA